MARPEDPIDPSTGPEAAFAVELRQLRELAGVTYRELAQRAHCSHAALCAAARGRKLPSWLVTEAFVRGCGGDERQWRARWEAVAAETSADSAPATAPRNDADEAVASPVSSDVKEELPGGEAPSLSSLTSPEDFHLALRALRTRAGYPSLRHLSVLARRNGGHFLPHSTLSDVLRRTGRLPAWEIVEAFLSACDVPATEADAVKAAWVRVANLLPPESMPGGASWRDTCPYRGLAAFTENQAEVFHGREQLTTKLVKDLAKRVRGGGGMLMVAGPSGAGKSSLLRAGLFPALAKGALGPGSRDWPRVVLTPGSAPLDALTVPLAQLAGVNSTEVRKSLIEHPGAAHLIVRQALLACSAERAGSELSVPPSRLVLVVDQFEELFTSISDKAEREAFITSLGAMAGVGCGTSEQPPAIVVVGLRDEFFGHCNGYTALADVRAHLFLVGPMTEIELRSAITGPAAAAGLAIEAGLVDNVIAELRSTSTAGGFDPGALPLLSQAMFSAWKHREGTTITHHAYAAGGGIRDSIQGSAEAVYKKLPPARQEAARELFRRMVTFTDHGQPTRRPVPLAEVRTDDDTRATLEEFATARLITLGEDAAEIVHEVLVHTWERLGGWINQDWERLRLHRELESAASVWERNQRDPTLLYHGSRYTAIRESLATTSAPLSASAQSFLDSARSQERRRKRKQRGLRRLLASLLVVAALLAGVGIVEQYYYAAQQNTSTANRYATNSRLLAAEHPDAAILSAMKGFSLLKTPVTRDALLSAQSQYFAGELTGHHGVINKVVFSPNGRLLATASADGTVRLWDVARRSLFALLASHIQVNDVEFSPNGQLLVTADAKGKIQLWDVASRQRITALTEDAEQTLFAATFSPVDDVNLLVTVSSGTARFWDVSRRQQFAPFGDLDHINAVVFSPGGKVLAAANANGTVQLWNVTDPHQPTRLGPPLVVANGDGDVNAVAFSPDGSTLATASPKAIIKLWNVQDPLHPVPGHELPYPGAIVNAMVFSPHGGTLAIASVDGATRLFDVSTPQQIGILRGSFSSTLSVAFHPDGHIVATAGHDGKVRLWDVDGPILTSPTLGTPVYRMAFGPAGHILATVGENENFQVWDTVRRQLVPISADYTGDTVALSGDGRLLAVADKEGIVRLWDITGQRPLPRLPGSTDKVHQLVFSPKNGVLATVSPDGVVRLWNITDPFHPASFYPFLAGHSSDVVAFSGDDRLLATAEKDGTTQLWDIASGRSIAKLNTGSVTRMAFSTDSGTLTTSGAGGVRRWDVASGKLIVTHSILRGNRRELALSSDGGTLATASGDDYTIELWDIDHPSQPIATLAGHTSEITTAVFSPDGQSLATASVDGTVRLWDLDPARVTRHLCDIIRTADMDDWKKVGPEFSYQAICG